MYLEHYNLNIKPFQISADPKFLWLGENHKEAMAVLKYGILDNKGFLLLTGDVGTGKTTLINALVNSLGKNIIIATVPDPGLELIDFLNYIAQGFGITKQFSQKGDFLVHFRHFLHKADQQGKKVLLIIDEAQRLNHGLLEEIRLLSNIEKQDRKLLNIFFVGQNEFNDMLWESRNRALRQRITVNHNVYALSAHETAAYISHRLKVAGTEKQIFAPDAIKEIVAFSEGFPRMINIICDHALLTGYVKGLTKIRSKEIKECAGDLQIPRSPEVAGEPLGAAEERSGNRKRSKQIPKAAEQALQKKMSGERPSFFRKFALYTAIIAVFSILAGLYYFIYYEGNRTQGLFKPKPSYPRNPAADEKPPVKKPDASQKQKMATEVLPGGQKTDPDIPGSIRGERPDSGFRSIPVASDSTEKAAPDLQTEIAAPEGQKSEARPATKPIPLAVSGRQPNTDGREKTRDLVSLQGETTAGGSVSEKKLSIPVPVKETSGAVVTQAVPKTSNTLLGKKIIINFPHDSNEFSESAASTLDRIAALLRGKPSLEINAVGYTDSSGVYSYNKSLSRFRANIVKSYLVGKGASPAQIKTIGMGPLNPVGTNDTATGRRSNRRVEIEFVMSPQRLQ